MKKSLKKNSGLKAIAGWASIVAGLSPSAWSTTNLQTFTQSTGPTYQSAEQGLLSLNPLNTDLLSRPWTLGAHYHFADNPLVEYNRATQQRTRVMMDGLHTLALQMGYQLNWGSVHAEYQVHTVGFSQSSYQFVSGDLRLLGKFQIWQSGDASYGLSVIPELYLPTGARDQLLSNGTVGAGAKLAFEKDFRYFRATANLGGKFFGSSGFRELDFSRQLPMSLAAFVPLTARVGANAEFYRTFVLVKDSDQGPGELFLGARAQLRSDVLLHGGVSFGQFDFDRSNDFRIHAGVRFSLGATRDSKIDSDAVSDSLFQSAAASEIPLAPLEAPSMEQAPDLSVPLSLSHIRFPTGSSQLSRSAQFRLKKIGSALSERTADFEQVVVDGHTDQRGSFTFNQKLSQKRAEAVRKAILNQNSLDSNKIHARGFSSAQPIAYGKNERAWAKNRRVELNFYGISADQKIGQELSRIDRMKLRSPSQSKAQTKIKAKGSQQASRKKATNQIEALSL